MKGPVLRARARNGIVALAVVVLVAGTQEAAAQAFEIASPVDWSGPYASVSFGAIRSDGQATADDVAGVLLPEDRRIGVLPDSVDELQGGAGVGFALGTSYQSGSLVGGIEAGLTLLDLDAMLDVTRTGPFPLPPPLTSPTVETSTSYRTKIDSLATVRWRAGFASGRNLFFVSAGVAGGEVRNEFGFGVVDIPALPGLPSAPYEAPLTSDEGFRWGYTLGLGFEHRVTERLSIRAEVVHFDLEDVTLRGEDPGTFPGEFVEYEFNNRGTVAMLGLSFSF